MTTFIASLAVTIPVVSWLVIRWNEETQRINDLTDYIISIPADEWKQ